ncbi:MAG: UpxY family transcription antiterminator [Desulfobacula sp.]|nr:UpxY family transcription antiterminator [Desulfobacula sp.]
MKLKTNWYALLTKSNFEQTVYAAVIKKKIEAFLPKIKKKSRRKDRQLMLELPIFPGYIFVKSTIQATDQLKILKTMGAVRILGNQSGPIAIPKFQIESLKILTSANMDLLTGERVPLKKKDMVQILSGPMAGVRGEFSRYQGRGRVIINIDLLRQYVGVEVSEENIEKIPDLLT